MRIASTAVALAAAMSLAASTVAAQAPTGDAPDAPRQIEVTILGMSCPFCAYGVEQKLKRLEGVADLEVVLETGLATIRMEAGADVSNALLQKTVKEAGFEVARITRDFASEFPDYEKPKE